MAHREHTIAIVDPDAAARSAWGALLRDQGYAVAYFDDAESCLASDPREQFCSVLLAMQLPGMDGFSALAALQAQPFPLPVICLTAHASIALAVNAMRQGAMDFLEKPCDPATLLRRVAECIALHHQRQLARQRHHTTTSRLASLTPREREVMHRILAGRLNKQIADDLSISMKTVEVHRSRMLEKMRVNSALELLGLLRDTGVSL